MKKIRKIATAVIIALVMSLLPQSAVPAVEDTVQAEAAVKLNKKKLTLEAGQKYTLKIKGSGKAFNWSSSDAKVAKVKRDKKYKNRGIVTAVSAGTAVIIATKGSKSYTCTVTVKKKSSDKTPTPAPTSAPTATPKPTAAPTAAPAASSSITAADSLGNYIPYSFHSSITGHDYTSQANKYVGTKRDYDENGSLQYDNDLSYKCYTYGNDLTFKLNNAGSGTIFVDLREPAKGNKYTLDDFKVKDFIQCIWVEVGSWYGYENGNPKPLKSYFEDDHKQFLDVIIECYEYTDKVKAFYIYLKVKDNDGKVHEIEGLFTETEETGTVTATPTSAPKATATPTPKPTAVPTPKPTAAPTQAPAATPVPQQASSYASPYTGNTFDIKDGMVNNLFKRTARQIDTSKVKLLLPSFESFTGGEVDENGTTETNANYNVRSYAGDYGNTLDMVKEYITLLTSSYGMKQEYYDCTYGSYYTWAFSYNGSAGIEKGKVEYPISDLYGYDLMIKYSAVYDAVDIYYPKDAEIVYTSDAATGKEALSASVERRTLEAYNGKANYFDIFGWSDHAGDMVNVFMPTMMYDKTTKKSVDFKGFNDNEGTIYVVCDEMLGLGSYAKSSGKNSERFKDIKAVVLECSDEAYVVYYYIKMESSVGVVYEFEGVAATERKSVKNFAGNGKQEKISNGNTIYLPVDGTTYVIDKGSTITLMGPFAETAYENYGYYFGAIQKGIVDVTFSNAKDTYAIIKGTAAGEAIVRISITGLYKVKHQYQLKYGDQRVNQYVDRYQSDSDEIYIKFVVQ